MLKGGMLMRKRRTAALLTAAVLAFSTIIAVAAAPANAASKIAVPDRAIEYYNAYSGEDPTIDNAEWEKTSSSRIKYNKKGYVTSGVDIGSAKWTLKNNKPASVKSGSKSLGGVSTAAYSKGKLKNISFKFYDDKGRSAGTATESVTYKKSWISQISGNAGGDKYKVTYSCKFYSGSMPKTVVEKFAEPYSTVKKTYTFNKKGLLTKVRSKYDSQTFKYKFDKKGRVIERITYEDGIPAYKCVYKYGGSAVKDKKTYMAVMNGPDLLGFFRDVRPSAFPLLAKSGG